MTIKSKTTPVIIFLFIMMIAVTILFFGICTDMIAIPIAIGLLFLSITVRFWIAAGREFTLSKKGCEVRFLCFSKLYLWDDLIVKRSESRQHISYKNKYSDGVYFFHRKIHKPALMSPVDYSLWIHPFSFIFINFRNANETKTEKALPAIYEAEKKEFYSLMKEWKITIE